ncbi:putative CCR4-NOT transcription complex subunit 4 [Helianthus anomalus]
MHELNKGQNRSVVNSCGEENDSLINCYCGCESPSNSSAVGHTGSSSSSSSGDSGGCYSGSMTEEDDGDDGCLDDWETISDALAADEIKNDHNRNLEPEMHEHSPQLEPVETSKDGQVNIRDSVNHQAWRPDDSFRPHGLPNLLKQNSLLNLSYQA